MTPQADLAGHIYTVPSDGEVPPGFIRSPTASGSGALPQHHAPPYARPPSEREAGRSRSPISFYAASPVPTGVTYPAPPVSRSAVYNANSYPQGVGSNPSVTSITSEGRRRRDSLSATAGMTPASKAKPVQSTGSADGGGRDSRHSRRQSTASLASQQSRPPYSRFYDPPTYLASADIFVDPVTGANTATNGGGGPVRPVRVDGSPAYMYTTLRTNE